ncbi:MAG: beta-lactamase family protein [Kosmotogaceae bacterium]|nr:beta-lactamase family protein [Kosmotogaceae bacterium]
MNLGDYKNGFSNVAAELEKVVSEGKIPGLSCGIRFGESVETATCGVTNLNHPLEVNDDTFFQIGSITKTFVALAVMRLVDRGRLDLERPLRDYLPSFKLSDGEAEKRLTMRHLLTHTSGLKGDYFKDFGYGNDALENMVHSMSALPQINPPGKILSYCNSGFYVAGRVIEVITGKPFEEAICELVSKPLDLDKIRFFPEEIITERFAVGHQVEREQISVARPWHIGRAMHPAGGIVTNVKDLLKYSAFYFAESFPIRSGIISEDSFKALTTGRIDASPASRVALGWFVEEIEGIKVLQHGGGTNGQISLLIIVPDLNFSAAILTNSSEGSKATSVFTRIVIESLLGLSPASLAPANDALKRAEKIVGMYIGEMSDLNIFKEDSKLFIREIPRGGFPEEDSKPAPPSLPQEMSISEEGFLIDQSEPFLSSAGEFMLDPSGEVAKLRIGLRIYKKAASQ